MSATYDIVKKMVSGWASLLTWQQVSSHQGNYEQLLRATGAVSEEGIVRELWVHWDSNRSIIAAYTSSRSNKTTAASAAATAVSSFSRPASSAEGEELGEG